jgi:LAS superfamily LD-carboxypeptidase LdcB
MLPSGVGPRAARPLDALRALVVVLVAVSLTLAAVPTAPPAAAAPRSDPRAERDRVRAEKAEVATQVDALRASDAELSTALHALDENVRGLQGAHADAQRAADEAEREAADAREAERQKQEEIDELRELVARLAVDSYVNPPTDDFLDTFSAESAQEAVRKRTMLDLRAGRDRDLLDELRGAQRDLEEFRRQAEEASAAAVRQSDEARARLAEVEGARAQQAAFAGEVQQRLDAKLSEAAVLASTDAELSQQIAAQEAAVAEQLRRQAEQAQASVARSGGGSAGGPPIPVQGPIPLANVRGIVVHASIAPQLEGLLAAAAASGFVLGGSGYRDVNRQIALRRQNCGASQYAIYEMSPEQCRPPTARPGASKHEQGLAVDFTWNGSTINSRSSAAFQWLAGNAGRWGFVNLPSEPWHWSVGGG